MKNSVEKYDRRVSGIEEGKFWSRDVDSMCSIVLVSFRQSHSRLFTILNLFHATGLFLYPHKTKKPMFCYHGSLRIQVFRKETKQLSSQFIEFKQ